MKYLYPKQIIYLHSRIVKSSGGSPALRDEGLLESAVYRPQAAFGGHEFYPDLYSKTAALGFSLIQNHPFGDGNKRIGFEAMRLTLRLNGHDIRASEDACFHFVMRIAKGELSEQEIADWLKGHSVPYKKA